MKKLFITGTDTEVGKTIATRALVQALSSSGLSVTACKPIACNNNQNSAFSKIDTFALQQNHDVLVLEQTNRQVIGYERLSRYIYPEHIEPAINYIADGTLESIELSQLDSYIASFESTQDILVIEGTHGWLTPINSENTYADWVSKEKIPTIIVVGIKGGCINHALLTIKSIESSGVKVVGWIANRINPGLPFYEEVIEFLMTKIDAPLLAEIPYIFSPRSERTF